MFYGGGGGHRIKRGRSPRLGEAVLVPPMQGVGPGGDFPLMQR